MRRSLAALLAIAVCACVSAAPPAPSAEAPAPKSLDEFRAAVQKVLDETGVPGAGIALVRQGGVEWAGGVGLADRDRQTPVTADTHFRAGSISKTFVAMALVQLAEDGDLDLDAPVAEIAPLVDIDNKWDATDPVRIIHLLQHTAGFDDMHFNETYNLADPPDMTLEEVLRINPRSRVVRWRPGTRMSYANPGFGVAAYVLERATGEKYEDVIRKKIFDPIGMTTSSFVLTGADEARLARGYEEKGGPAVPYTQIYLRPAGNLHTSPAELGKFVELLLNWGETAEELVVDPEFLSNMEHPRSTLASRAGLRNGYGSAIYSTMKEPFPLLGHNGGIDGFSSSYAYSPARDAGYVVLLNATYSSEAMERISSLAIRYLKADIEPPEKPRVTVAADVLRTYEGYYHDASPRLQAMAFVEWLLAGRTIAVEGDALVATPVFGARSSLIPVSDNLFRLDNEVDATRAFTLDDDGTMVLTGAGYAERVRRWRVEIVRWPVLVSLFLTLTPIAALLAWLAHARLAEPLARFIHELRRNPPQAVRGENRGQDHTGNLGKQVFHPAVSGANSLRRSRVHELFGLGFWWLKSALVLCAVSLLAPVIAIILVDGTHLGVLNVWTAAMFLGTVTLPAAALVSAALTIAAWRNDAGRWLRAYAAAVSCAALVVSAYLVAWGVVGFMPWRF